MLGPDAFPPSHCQVSSWEQMPRAGQCVIFQLEYCELKHGRAAMFHSMAACAPPSLPHPLCIPHYSHSCSPSTHPASPFGDPPLCPVDGWALHCCAFVPSLARYPGILLFPPHSGAFRSRISKHWEEICGSDQNHTRIKITLFSYL